MERLIGLRQSWQKCCRSLFFKLRMFLMDGKGQGTTEYAILVGVLVVIAIIAVTAFRGKLQELWEAISSGINDL
ncbi:MAG: class III signal peptide-containing protein [Coriobacteriaceae bacterium]|nr:class III signal peptide-containing protein [Coriobacteriaceae bacterium]